MINFFRLVLAGLALAMAALVSAVTTMHFAIHGAVHDGHDFVAAALKAGASLRFGWRRP